jgi:hypothetical protein
VISHSWATMRDYVARRRAELGDEALPAPVY